MTVAAQRHETCRPRGEAELIGRVGEAKSASMGSSARPAAAPAGLAGPPTRARYPRPGRGRRASAGRHRTGSTRVDSEQACHTRLQPVRQRRDPTAGGARRTVPGTRVQPVHLVRCTAMPHEDMLMKVADPAASYRREHEVGRQLLPQRLGCRPHCTCRSIASISVSASHDATWRYVSTNR
jgi:hypothetical protein